MKLMISALIAATARLGFCFWFLDTMSYTNPHPFTTITLDRDRYWWVECMADEKKKANQELRTIEYVHKHGRFIDITHRTPVIKRPKKPNAEPVPYVNPSSIPEIIGNPGKYHGDKEKSNENAD